MNQITEFLAEQNSSYLSGKAIESILQGDLKEAQDLLKREEKRLEKLPKIPVVMELPSLEPHKKVQCQDLPENAKVCQNCVKRDHANDLPFDYTITVHTRGNCDSCGVDAQLTNIVKVRSDIEAQAEPKTEKLGSVFAPELK